MSANSRTKIYPTTPQVFALARWLKASSLLLSLVFLVAGTAAGQADPERVGSVLGEEIISPSVAVFQMKQFLLSRAAPPPTATTAAEWTAEAQRLRAHLLNDVVFHGWPKAWVDSPPRFEETGVIETGDGYRLRKLRYEVVPGFWSAAILYEPEKIQGKMPAILNVNGHVGPRGKSVEYKQKRCINFAKHGIFALNLEWFAFGELNVPGNGHWFGAHLDLVGVNEVGLFYLEMRRGLDYLYNHPNVDRDRLGMTGLSGGGWQTIILSSLDPRVTVAVPVAGYSALSTKVEARRYGDRGDLEQNAPDLMAGDDYTHLTALRAPRPTLLINNAEDDCCFRGPLVKPLIYDGIRPFFALYGKTNDFQYHENRDPGTHNYQLDNREAAYRFFSEHFGLPVITSEIPVGQEIKSYDELVVGLPKDNQTVLGLARKLAGEIARPPIPSDAAARTAWARAQRGELRDVVRYKPVRLARAWTLANSKNHGVETRSYLFEMNNGLSAEGVWLKGIVTPEKPPVTIVLNDQGMKAAAVDVSDAVNRDEQVLSVDLLFAADVWKDGEAASYGQLIDSVGERTLGVEAAQLLDIVHWIRGRAGVPKVRLECRGIRSQVVALVAAALEPDLFSSIEVHEGMPSLNFLLAAPVTFQEAPDLFCLDLYKDFDLDRLAAMAAPAQVKVEKYVEVPRTQTGAAAEK
jgi:dienelactone hydrolase